MAAADILFMSGERLPEAPEPWAHRVMARYSPAILVIGLGAEGALLALRDGTLAHHPAVATRPVVSTVGAGDALFAAFLHSYEQSGDPEEALRRAMLFASYKIGVASASEGFLSAAELEAMVG